MATAPPAERWRERLLYTTRAATGERDWLLQRAGNILLHLHPPRVPAAALRFSATWGLGGISATLALLLAATGVLLMFRYEPSVEGAYLSIQHLESSVAFGSLVRAVHHWSANLLMVTSLLHLARVFLTGAYKKERTTNWLIGLALLCLVVAFIYTGYLLPWDQFAYWAATVSTAMLRYLPLVGQALSDLALAAPEVGQGALSNFYALHVAVLPLMTVLALAYHFWRVRKDGGVTLPESEQESERLTSIPHLIRREYAAAAAVIVLVALWAMLTPAPLGEMADVLHPPNPAKAAWYLVGLQELMLHMDALAAEVLVAIIAVGMVLLPRWDPSKEGQGVYFRSAAGRKAAIVGAVLALDLVPALVVIDAFWLDLPSTLSSLPVLISNGLVPLILTLLGLGGLYLGLRRILKSNHSEALVGLFSFIMMSMVVLTVIGALFRGPDMALVLPF